MSDSPYWKPSDPDWRRVSLPSKPSKNLLVKAVPGELTRFWVESETLWCSACETRHGAQAVADKRIKVGDACKERDCNGILETYYYICDLAEWGKNGACNCPRFDIHYRSEISKTKPETWILSKFRCKHLEAAYALAGLMYVEMCERQRWQKHPRQRRQEGVGA